MLSKPMILGGIVYLPVSLLSTLSIGLQAAIDVGFLLRQHDHLVIRPADHERRLREI